MSQFKTPYRDQFRSRNERWLRNALLLDDAEFEGLVFRFKSIDFYGAHAYILYNITRPPKRAILN